MNQYGVIVHDKKNMRMGVIVIYDWPECNEVTQDWICIKFIEYMRQYDPSFNTESSNLELDFVNIYNPFMKG